MSNKEISPYNLLQLRLKVESFELNSQRSVDPVAQFEAPLGEAREQKQDPAEVLAELYGLLEDYAPAWYTLEHHQKAEMALRVVYRL